MFILTIFYNIFSFCSFLILRYALIFVFIFFHYNYLACNVSHMRINAANYKLFIVLPTWCIQRLSSVRSLPPFCIFILVESYF